MAWSTDYEMVQTLNAISVVESPTKTYLECSLHIALERSDTNRDWRVFKYLLNLDRDFLMSHLKMTQAVFDYNVYKLPKAEQDEIFG
jgi:hypothetical protein